MPNRSGRLANNRSKMVQCEPRASDNTFMYYSRGPKSMDLSRAVDTPVDTSWNLPSTMEETRKKLRLANSSKNKLSEVIRQHYGHATAFFNN